MVINWKMMSASEKSQRISNALLMVLGTLPQDAELHFFWRDGRQHMSVQLPGMPAQVTCMHRMPDGTGVPTPVMH